MAGVIESEPVNEATVGDKAEHARLWISGLRLRRYRADFRETATHGQDGIGNPSILVVTSSNADRIWEIQSKKTLL